MPFLRTPLSRRRKFCPLATEEVVLILPASKAKVSAMVTEILALLVGASALDLPDMEPFSTKLGAALLCSINPLLIPSNVGVHRIVPCVKRKGVSNHFKNLRKCGRCERFRLTVQAPSPIIIARKMICHRKPSSRSLYTSVTR